MLVADGSTVALRHNSNADGVRCRIDEAEHGGCRVAAADSSSTDRLAVQTDAAAGGCAAGCQQNRQRRNHQYMFNRLHSFYQIILNAYWIAHPDVEPFYTGRCGPYAHQQYLL